MSLYEQGSFHTGGLSITETTLIVNKDNTTTDQLRRWAILIDTGAMISPEHFNHMQTKPLRQQDPQTLTAVNGENIHIYGIKEVTLVHDNLAIPATFILCDVKCAILGLDTITKNKLHLKFEGYKGHLARGPAGLHRTSLLLEVNDL
eukprot:2683828-Amphidinium_carterae.1